IGLVAILPSKRATFHGAAAALLALTAPAAAGDINCAPVIGQLGSCGANNHLILPPAYYDHPFDGVVIENAITDMADMARVCAPNPLAAVAMACASRYTHPSGERRCYIYIAPDDYLNRYRVTIDAVRRHEVAHCNGWPQAHPRLLEGNGKGVFDP